MVNGMINLMSYFLNDLFPPVLSPIEPIPFTDHRIPAFDFSYFNATSNQYIFLLCAKKTKSYYNEDLTRVSRSTCLLIYYFIMYTSNKTQFILSVTITMGHNWLFQVLESESSSIVSEHIFILTEATFSINRYRFQFQNSSHLTFIGSSNPEFIFFLFLFFLYSFFKSTVSTLALNISATLSRFSCSTVLSTILKLSDSERCLFWGLMMVLWCMEMYAEYKSRNTSHFCHRKLLSQYQLKLDLQSPLQVDIINKLFIRHNIQLPAAIYYI